MSLWYCTGCKDIIHSSSPHFFNPCGQLEFFNPKVPPVVTEAIFKCQKCEQTFALNLALQGLFVAKCSSCGSVYVDCQNLEECLNEL
jgi:DNA-directed RNA polymerase subunit RPC12/RpoP